MGLLRNTAGIMVITMSQSFDVILACGLTDLSQCFSEIRKEFHKRRFLRCKTIDRTELQERGDDAEEELELPDDPNLSIPLPEWTGLTASFWCEEFLLDLGLYLFPGGYINCTASMNQRTVHELMNTRRKMFEYYGAISAIANACQAAGGYGGSNLDPVPLDPASVVQSIAYCPQNQGYPSELGVLQSSTMGCDDMKEFAAETFRVWREGGYWFLESLHFLDVYGRIAAKMPR